MRYSGSAPSPTSKRIVVYMYGEMSSVPMENVTGAIWSSRCSKLQCTMSMRRARNTNARTYPYLIRPACLGQVSHPFDALIVTLLEDLQETHDQARRCEHEHLEVDVDRRARPHRARRRRGQLPERGERALLPALQPRDPACRQHLRAGCARGRTSRRRRSPPARTWPCRARPCSRRRSC